ncbi:hypothetical protein DFQ27_002958 [Actinomortierella ambigua]|uniref:F-box domain-containing protein n=1 Tax=Actinomortierella ambigua TaxID=1343610 RepID=A0A9P6Q609_9FUNG|nr:hypothetical protein DFQ27_002958 [Actinomortierella ambigua]
MPPTLVKLPTELLLNIFLHLRRHDLAQCVRRLRFMSDETQQALVRNAAFVRELHVADEDLYDLFFLRTPSSLETQATETIDEPIASLFTNLHTLVLHYIKHPRQFNQCIVALVRQNPGIRRFAVHYNMMAEILVNLLSNHLPNMQEFCLTRISWHGDVKWLLENLPETIKTVALLNVHHRRMDMGLNAKADQQVSGVRHHHNLQSLHIQGQLAEQEVEVLLPFLESCSHKLKSVTGLGMAFLKHHELVKAMAKIGFVWSELTDDDFLRYLYEDFLIDWAIAVSISRSSQWTKIELRTTSAGPSTASALVLNGANLEILDIDGYTARGPGMRGSHLQEILSKAPRLRTLRAHWLIHDNSITARDILSSEWATTSLEHVDFKINVPRVDDEGGGAPDSPAAQSSRAIQRQVLRRLGQQKNLRKLMVGGKVVSSSTEDYEFQRNCLEMTLESGLDELAGLKNLVELDIHDMDHRVGVPELEWMVENFPKLECVKGMAQSLNSPSPEVREWLQTHRSQWAAM